MIDLLNELFNKPGFNKSGFCQEAGISYQWLLEVLAGRAALSKRVRKKIEITLIDYQNIAQKILNYEDEEESNDSSGGETP